VGGLSEFKQKSAAKIMAHKEEADFLRNGYTPFFHPLPTMCTHCWKAGRDLSKPVVGIFYPGHGRPFTIEKLMKSYDRLKKRWKNRL